MTSAEARERMDAALDGDLTAEEQRAFERALAADESLRAEYAELARLIAETRSLGKQPALANIDLLAGVQQRLRERSGGKFYRDKFAEARGRSDAKGGMGTSWMLALAVIVLLAVSAWLAFDAGLFAAPVAP